jgi:hypothetical protein
MLGGEEWRHWRLVMTMLRRLLLALVLVLTAGSVTAAEPYTTAALVRDKGIAALVARMGESRPVVRVTFAPDEIVAVAQADAGSGFAQWIVRRLDLGIMNLHYVNGPTQAFDSGIVDDPAGAYFRLSDIDLTGSTAWSQHQSRTRSCRTLRWWCRSRSRGRSRSCPSRALARFAGR